jgi:putative transposase
MHFLRNALTYTNKSQRQMVFALINTIFAQESADATRGQCRIVTDQLREKLPKLAAMMDGDEHEVLAFMDFPKGHHVKIHSTNVIERLNGEIKRRSGAVSIFPNEAAIRRLAGALLLEQNGRR